MIITMNTEIEHNIHLVAVDDTTSWWLVRVYGGAELVACGELALDLEEAIEELDCLARTSWRRKGLVWADPEDGADADEDMRLDPVDR